MAASKRAAPVLSCDRRVWGPPGCGKTYRSTRDVAERVEDAARVTAVTFRSDMVDDLTEGLMEAGVLPCDEGAEWPFVGTVHGVARRLLDHDLVDCVYRVAPREGDEGEEVKRKRKDHARDFFEEWRNGAIPYRAQSTDRLKDPGGVGGLGDLFLALRSWRVHTEEREPVQLWHNWPEVVDRGGSESLFEEFREEWSRFKKERGVWDWDDLLLDVESFGYAPPSGVMFVDEAQDNSPFIHRVLAEWAEEMDFVVVAGDGNQAIYRFIGADPELFFDRTRGGEELFLGTTYRVPEATWGFAETALETSGHRVPELEFDKAGGASARLSWTEFQNSLDRVGPLRSIFHLVRCNFQIEPVAKQLRRAGIPFTAPGPLGWSGKDVLLYNAVVKARQKQSLAPPEALALVETYPSGEDVVRCVKKGFRESPREVSAVNWSDVFGPKVGKWLSSRYPLSHSLASSVSETQEERIHAALGRLDGDLIDEIGHEISTIHGAKGREKRRVYLFDGITPTIEETAWPLHEEPEEARVWYVAASRHLEELLVVDYPETLASPFLQGGEP